MKANVMSVLAAACMALISASAFAISKQENKVDNATEVLVAFSKIPETRIPARLLANAYGIAVIPNVVKASLTVGGRWGRGLLTVRDANGNWTNPTFVTLTGGSFGLQAGIQSTDVILVFRGRRSIDNITGGKLTLGADASIAAGPVGRQGSAATDLRFKAEVYSYSRSRGLFAGVSLEGAVLAIHNKWNTKFYGEYLTPDQIFAGIDVDVPAPALTFIDTLSGFAPTTASVAVHSDQNEAPSDDGFKTYPVTEPERVSEATED